MPFCPFCGSEINSESSFCENCGKNVKGTPQQPSYQPHQEKFARQPTYQSSGGGKIEYDDTICLVLCCCLSPIAALIYYLLTDHPDNYDPNRRY